MSDLCGDFERWEEYDNKMAKQMEEDAPGFTSGINNSWRNVEWN